MGRKNIFDILSKDIDMYKEMNKLHDLYISGRVMTDFLDYSLENFFEIQCLPKWKNRNRLTTTQEFRVKLGITDRQISYGLDEVHCLLFMEFLYNVVWLIKQNFDSQMYFSQEGNYLVENLEDLAAHMNFEFRIIHDEEKVILVEKNAASTAVAEIVEDDLARMIIEYNHFLLKGDLLKKQQILKQLADKFESVRNNIKMINKELESIIGFAINKMNIRHNNIEGSNAIQDIIDMKPEELEAWYDEVYQMLLLAMLEYDNIQRMERVKDLKKKMGY